MDQTSDRPGAYSPAALRRLVPSLLLNLVLPFVLYRLARPHVDSDAAALAIGAGLAAAATIGRSLWRRRIDPIGVLSITGFGVALLISVLTGGSRLAFELRDPVVLGLVGLAFLGSLVGPRPLHLVIVSMLARREEASLAKTDDPAFRRTSMVMTAVIGLTLTVRSAAMIALAINLPTGTYLVVAKIVGWSIIAAGACVALAYRHAVQRAASPPAAP
jgi:hypothetical protein